MFHLKPVVAVFAILVLGFVKHLSKNRIFRSCIDAFYVYGLLEWSLNVCQNCQWLTVMAAPDVNWALVSFLIESYLT